MNRMSSGTSRPTGIQNTYEAPTHANKETLPQKGTVINLKKFWETKAKANTQTQPGEMKAPLKPKLAFNASVEMEEIDKLMVGNDTEEALELIKKLTKSFEKEFTKIFPWKREGQEDNVSVTRCYQALNEAKAHIEEAELEASEEDANDGVIYEEIKYAKTCFQEAIKHFNVAIGAEAGVEESNVEDVKALKYKALLELKQRNEDAKALKYEDTLENLKERDNEAQLSYYVQSVFRPVGQCTQEERAFLNAWSQYHHYLRCAEYEANKGKFGLAYKELLKAGIVLNSAIENCRIAFNTNTI